MEYINGKDLYQMFNYGMNFIRKERSYLNDINVFPVADGDTGNNLLQTLKTIVLESTVDESFSKTLESISNSALIGARGNSGVIFAQFVNGLQKANGTKERVSITEFSDLINESYNHTHSALSNPVEGTMITILKEWANLLQNADNENMTMKEVFSYSLVHLQDTLKKTKTMLDVLTENDVVDSGAMGLVLFVQGIVSYYNNEELDIEEYEQIKISDQHHFEGESNYRYCTEGLVKFEKLNQKELRSELEKHGDSVIIAEGKSRFRIHIHTDTPEIVFQILKRYGDIETQKIDDMKLEQAIKDDTRRRVLVTDSIADITQNILDDNNVLVIPVNISIDNVPYLDKITINNQILFDGLDSYEEYPKTATPAIKYISDLFNRLLLKFDEVIVVTVSSQLSATYDVIKKEAEKLIKKGKKITVIDSYNNSATEGLLVEETIKLLNDDVPTELIVKKIEDLREKTQILVCLETFKYATMSGRLPKVVGKIGMLFGLRPIMSLNNGKGSAFGIALSQKGITKKIKSFVKKDVEKSGIESYSLVHCMNEEAVKEYEEIFTEIIGKKPSYVTEISSATAIHSGVGSVAIGYIKKSVKE